MGHDAIIGLGNPLMADDGAGIRVVETLQRRRDLPPDIDVVDLGTGGMRVLHEVQGRDRVVFIDCTAMGEPAGAYRVFRPGEARSRKVQMRLSVHEGDLLQMVDLMEQLGIRPREIAIVGIQPGRVGWGEGLSPAVAARLEDYADAALDALPAAARTAKPCTSFP